MSNSLNASSSPFPLYGRDPYTHYARNIIKKFHKDLIERTGVHVPIGLPPVPPEPSPSTAASARIGLDPTEEYPVGILGAGASGLYAAMILQTLNVPYKILEAREDVGGRLFTYHFPNSTGNPYSYFDVGAMRFPRINVMKRVFDLFNLSELDIKAKLRPYLFEGAGNNGKNNTFLDYNRVTVQQSDVPSGDPFHSASVIQDTDSDPYIAAGVKAIMDDVIGPFATKLLDDLDNGKDDGWNYLMEYNDYSTRSYMAIAYTPSDSLKIPKKPLPTDVINWCETFDKSTGWYDRSLAETVLEAISFGWQPPADQEPKSIEWVCIDGGSNEIAQSMAKYLRKQKSDVIQLKSKVEYIGLNKITSSMDVVTRNTETQQTETHQFSHVISTIPLPVLRSIDMSAAGLTHMQANAIRTLNYGPSIKVGMQFKTAWWTTGNNSNGSPLDIVGGQSFTDGPLRTIVYPSYGNVKNGETTTLIASYCWTEDSERLAAIIEKDKALLVRLVLRELARIHNVTIDFLTGELLDTFGWSWTNDPYAMGAFAFFGPGKFQNLYTSLTTPGENRRLHFASEALSARHAWVEGALDSAWTAVNEMILLMDKNRNKYLTDFYTKWSYNPEWFAKELPSPRDGGPVIPDIEDNLLLQQICLTHPEYFAD